MAKAEFKKGLVTFKHQDTLLKFELRIPLKNIHNVSTETIRPPFFSTFYAEGKIFYYVRNRFKCIILELRNHDYSEIVMEVDDPFSVEQKLRELTPPRFSLREYVQRKRSIESS
ncbi:MAG: hypothetical protein OEZ48_15125 [Candidatus Bathyarchaeota archaeon]|nr:hypothetical protein [Candidatus Bathyarchaeota archaeon]MDH5689179.1 hypothetical protein [Candidatus Bathyarchaeota archaeon]